MKYTIRQIKEGENEVILQYLDMTPEVQRIWSLMNGEQTKLTGWREKMLTVIDPKEVLYIESVDGKTFAYTDEDVLKLDNTLNRLEQILNEMWQ